MGQRLVVNIVSNDQILACGYFHWSAYTSESVEMTKNIVKNVIPNHEKAQCLSYYSHYGEVGTYADSINKLTAYLMLEDTGAGIYMYETDSEIKEFKKIDAHYNYRVGENRSQGHIALTPENIKYLNSWAEGTVNIDISNDTVYFDVFARYEPDEVEEINEYNESNGIGKYEIKEIDFSDITRFNFEEVDTWYDKIKEMCNDKGYPFFKDKANDTVYYQVIA